ncbi:MAG: SDR family oxidoreductase [Treponema sp.]|jgi:2-deoxy-D-gluconate 3-dehydrogenase|nr:SDR family oxidoreductase [Treponema sp.]
MNSPLEQLFDIRGKTAVVTGAAGGIGACAAGLFYDLGATVVFVDINAAALDEQIRKTVSGGETRPGPAAADAAGPVSGRAIPIACDLTSEAEVLALRDQVIEKAGPVDILVNSHGISKRASADEMSVEQFDTLLDVNLRSVFLLTAIIGRTMGRGGSIINISSIAAHVCMPNNVNYAAAKGGLEAMTRSFAGEWAGRGVRVNAVAPGPCRTGFTESLYSQENYVESLLKKIPRGEIAIPFDMAGPILLLSTRAGLNITGQTLIVDGGFTII